jgi:acyl-CoA thioesterase
MAAGAGDVSEHAFDADTRVEAVTDSAFAATITSRWDAIGGRPNGGYVLAVCLQALRRVLPFPDPLAVSAFFLRPTMPGPVEVHTEIVRAGRTMATGGARVVQAGKETVRVTATFVDLAHAAGRTLVVGERPDLPATDSAIDPLGGRGIEGLPITERVEYRVAAIPGWMQGKPSGDPSMEFWMRFRDGRDADVLALALLVDAVYPAVMEIGATGSSTLELTVHVRAHPASGWLACRARTRYVIGGYHEEDFEIWDGTGALVAQSRQLALLAP